MEDCYLRRFVVDELDYDPRVTAAHVGSYAEKLAAERIALNVRGVRAVVDEVEVRTPEDARIGDEDLADRCARAIAWDVTIPSDSVRVKVEKGCVTLSGWVERYDQKAAADRALRRFAGVADIVNVIGVRPSGTSPATGVRPGASVLA